MRCSTCLQESVLEPRHLHQRILSLACNTRNSLRLLSPISSPSTRSRSALSSTRSRSALSRSALSSTRSRSARSRSALSRLALSSTRSLKLAQFRLCFNRSSLSPKLSRGQFRPCSKDSLFRSPFRHFQQVTNTRLRLWPMAIRFILGILGINQGRIRQERRNIMYHRDHTFHKDHKDLLQTHKLLKVRKHLM